MGLVSPTQSNAGDTIEAADINTPVNQLAAVINGSIETANIADSAVTAAKLADGSVTGAKLDSDAVGHGFLEIGRTTLGSAGDTITVSALPARKYLRIVVYTTATGGTADHYMRFNGDTGMNYGRRISDNGGADNTAGTSQTGLALDTGAVAVPMYSSIEVVNVAAQEKLVQSHNMHQNTAGAANVPARRELVGKWANTSNQISSVTITNVAGTGDFNTGSEVVVFGSN